MRAKLKEVEHFCLFLTTLKASEKTLRQGLLVAPPSKPLPKIPSQRKKKKGDLNLTSKFCISISARITGFCKK